MPRRRPRRRLDLMTPSAITVHVMALGVIHLDAFYTQRMSRWQPNAAERLMNAAIELFADRGYDNVTVAEIAERAGLTKRTFFRHFADKREILFGGQDEQRRLLVDAIVHAPASATPLDAVSAGVLAFADEFRQDQRETVTRRQTIICNHPDLQERELSKKAALTTAMTEALHQRGVTEPTATLAARIGALAFELAFQRWHAPTNRQTLAKLASKMFRDCKKAAAAL